MPRITPRPESAPGPQTEDGRLKAELNARYEALNALWKKAEDQLRQFMVPDVVALTYKSYVDLDDETDAQNELETHCSLGWARAKGSWRICAGFSHDHYCPDISWTPITEASLGTRKECVKHFPKLKQMVIERASRLIPELDEVIASLSEALN